MTRALVLLAALAATGVSLSSAGPQQAFITTWLGRTVLVKAPIYSLVYDERGALGTARRGLREGLLVTTASGAAYLQFDGRQGRDAVVQQDPGLVVAAVNAAYEADALDVRSYRKLEARSVGRYDPGVALVVAAVRVQGDVVRVDLASREDGDPVTGIRVKWPQPLSKAFDERERVERAMRQYIDLAHP